MSSGEGEYDTSDLEETSESEGWVRTERMEGGRGIVIEDQKIGYLLDKTVNATRAR